MKTTPDRGMELTHQWTVVARYRCIDPRCHIGVHQEVIHLGIAPDDDDRLYMSVVSENPGVEMAGATALPLAEAGEFLADYIQAFVTLIGTDSPEARNLLETANVLRLVKWRKQ